MSKSVSVKREVRFQQWVDQVKEFNSRPSGMSMNAWCRMKGISPSTFATRLHKVQDRYLDSMSSLPVATADSYVAPANNQPTFVEVTPAMVSHVPSSAATIICGNTKIEVNEDVSEAFLIKLIGAMSHVK